MLPYIFKLFYTKKRQFIPGLRPPAFLLYALALLRLHAGLKTHLVFA